MTAFAELCAISNFSFLRGASHPEELVLTAAVQGHAAIAIADWNGVSGLVRAHGAAKEHGIRLVPAARLVLDDGPPVVVYPTDRAAWGRLTRLLSLGKRRVKKGACRLTLADLAAEGFAGGAGQIAAAVPPRVPDAAFEEALTILRNIFKKKLYLIVSYAYDGMDRQRLAALSEIARRHRVKLLASNDVHAHAAARRPLQDVLSCIREGTTVHEAGHRLHANAERHLKPPKEMARLFEDHPEAVRNSLDIAASCKFSLDELRYEYPVDPVSAGATPQSELERLVREGAERRYPDGVPAKVTRQIEHELALIGELGFAPYFLTVHDLVRFAGERGILCQGRGSAANSAVCYALGITAVDPAKSDLLFERFVSAERGEPPDIDVDFENARREEVIQYVYEKYGREHAGITATVITYRTKGALREAGKAMGLSDDVIVALQQTCWRRHWSDIGDEHVREAGLDPAEPSIQATLRLAGELLGFPRHLSQHSGGMVMTASPLTEVVPVANAAMADRTMIEWDKDDLDALGILKIDVLGLAMLTCIRKCFELIARHSGEVLDLAAVPQDDDVVYEMLCRADAIGVFQVESRAQMSMLPRLKPRTFYDLVIEVAIVRPGPIQGDMVHPYLRRREKREKVTYPSEKLRKVLEKTEGVPLFQEQAMQIAIVGAGFTPTEADQLRRSLAAFRRMGDIAKFRDRFVQGMVDNGYEQDFAERCFKQIEGFADYGFPESHAASFALLVYVSAWLKCHYPAAFAAALLNSQPMGFYAPAQIVRDAREHGVEVRAVDVNRSRWDCTLEPGEDGMEALRLGFRQVKGLSEDDMHRLVAARLFPYRDMVDVARRASLDRAALEKLARADAFRSLKLDRRAALWAVKGLEETPLPLFAGGRGGSEPEVDLPGMCLGEQVADDYRATSLSLRGHPVGLLRPWLAPDGYQPAVRLRHLQQGDRFRIAGVVTARQRPGSARGVMFLTLEDETSIANLIVWPHVMERFRRQAVGATLLGATGEVQREGRVIHVLADELADLTPLLGHLDQATGVPFPHGPMRPGGDETRAAEPASRLRFPSRDFR